MFGVYKKLLYYVPKQRPLAYFAIGLTVVSTLFNVVPERPKRIQALRAGIPPPSGGDHLDALGG